MRLPPDWSALFRLLFGHEVRFLVVGAHAVAANGRPRATQDLDLLIEPTPENARRFGLVLHAFGFPGLAVESARFAELGRMATLGNPPLRIDLMTSITGVTFEEAWRGRLIAPFGSFELGFLGREQLMINKRATGRPKDLADLALLTEGSP